MLSRIKASRRMTVGSKFGAYSHLTPNCGGFRLPLIYQLIGSQIGSICRPRAISFVEHGCASHEIALGQHNH